MESSKTTWLKITNFHDVETHHDPNEATALFYNFLNNILSRHAPLKVKRVKRETQPSWFNDEVKSAMHERDMYQKNRQFDQCKSVDPFEQN